MIDQSFLIYFFAGVIQDFLATLNLRFTAKDKVVLAAISAFLTQVVTMVVLYNILTRLDAEKSIVAIITYSLGIAVGTVLGMQLNIGKTNS